MTTSRDVLASSPDICRGQISWDYDRAEIIADGVVQVIGACLGLIGAMTLVVITVRMERIEVTSILVYVIGPVTMLALSDPTAIIPFSRKQQTANNAGGAKTCCRTVPRITRGKIGRGPGSKNNVRSGWLHRRSQPRARYLPEGKIAAHLGVGIRHAH